MLRHSRIQHDDVQEMVKVCLELYEMDGLI